MSVVHALTFMSFPFSCIYLVYQLTFYIPASLSTI